MQDFKQRTILFAVGLGELILDFPNDAVYREHSGQLVSSSSSAGAKYRPAKRAKPGADFINKLKISEGETDEPVYFPGLLRELNPWFKERFSGLIIERTEPSQIISSLINTTRSGINSK